MLLALINGDRLLAWSADSGLHDCAVNVVVICLLPFSTASFFCLKDSFGIFVVDFPLAEASC